MPVQSEQNNANRPFILSGESKSRENETILQDAGRTADLVDKTVMAKVAASGKWVPFIDETETDGSAIPQGVYRGSTILAATLVAGDVTGQVIIIGDAILDTDQVVMDEGTKALTTIVTVGTTDLRTVQDRLADRGIFLEATVITSQPENA